eukprot:TRINITY_DN69351_c0_g1_i1.p2 TRINITY_DN69351_c0_g1~~TRINITY_DN69351_c0_g1_i1.p2  ORF type:complete len:139 (-),score=16.92 TRINITY_DN69351_c0_g1_i1:270-686(-)
MPEYSLLFTNKKNHPIRSLPSGVHPPACLTSIVDNILLPAAISNTNRKGGASLRTARCTVPPIILVQPLFITRIPEISLASVVNSLTSALHTVNLYSSSPTMLQISSIWSVLSISTIWSILYISTILSIPFIISWSIS